MDGAHKAPRDFISNMPDNVVTSILDRLPIQDAVRTGILARNWRFKWTILSQLILGDNFLTYLSKKKAENNQMRVIISRLLLSIRGAITKFFLSVHDGLNVEDEDISHWILNLSGKGIKDLTIRHLDGRLLKLPTHLFSCLELEHLNLCNCCFSPQPPTFHGFPNLLSLELARENSELGEFITRCPLLEKLKLTTTIINSYNIFELLGSLPKLEELQLDFQDYQLTEGGAKKKFPTAFLSLKALNLVRMDLGNGLNLSCAFELIKSLPNLQTLRILAIQCDVDPIPGLRIVMFTSFAGSENEMCLTKYLLACSPSLEKCLICPSCRLASRDQLIIATKLLKLPRASTVAKIDFAYF